MNGMKIKMVKGRVEIYQDFALSLLYNIDKYYLDEKTLSSIEDISNHFMWCFNKVCNEFLIEDIDFTMNKELFEYYKEYYILNYYSTKKNRSFKFLEKFWKGIFDTSSKRDVSSIGVLLEVYEIQDRSIKL